MGNHWMGYRYSGCYEWWIADYPCSLAGTCGETSFERKTLLTNCNVLRSYGHRVHCKWPQPVAQAIKLSYCLSTCPGELANEDVWGENKVCFCVFHVTLTRSGGCAREIQTRRRRNRLIWAELHVGAGQWDKWHLKLSCPFTAPLYTTCFYLLHSNHFFHYTVCRDRHLCSTALLATAVLCRCGV